MHTRMRLPANERRVRFEYADRAVLGADGARFPASAQRSTNGAREVTLVAAHMHGHGMLERYEFGLIRPASSGESSGERRVPIGILEEGYAGYGADQSFMALPDAPDVGRRENTERKHDGRRDGSRGLDVRALHVRHARGE